MYQIPNLRAVFIVELTTKYIALLRKLIAMSPILFWFRNDLRLHDNPALWAAVQTQRPVVAVFVYDDVWMEGTWLDFKRCDRHRKAFLDASVLELKRQLMAMGGDLLVYKGDTVDVIHRVCAEVGVHAVYAQREFAAEEVAIEGRLAQLVTLELFWGNMLFAPHRAPFSIVNSPFYFTAFKNKVAGLLTGIEEAPTVTNMDFFEWGSIPMQSASYHPAPVADVGLVAGETEALRLMRDFVNDASFDGYILSREMFLCPNGSSGLSPYLAVGSLSVVRFYKTILELAGQRVAAQDSVAKLIDQLVWRDYYQWLFLRYGSKIFRPTGLRKVTPVMYDDFEAFDRWRNGQTGEPLIDALMGELLQTGLMSNRGRMVAAYYLSKVLSVNWLWGAYWFESQLVDFDVCNNYGNWAYQSGTGTDSRINRRFNIAKQVQKFDPNGTYLQKWG